MALSRVTCAVPLTVLNESKRLTKLIIGWNRSFVSALLPVAWAGDGSRAGEYNLTRPDQFKRRLVRMRSLAPVSIPVSMLAALGLGAAVSLFSVSTSEASYYYNYGYYGYSSYRAQPRVVRRSRPAVRKRRVRRQQPQKQEAAQKVPAKPITGPVTVVVSIGEQRVRVFDSLDKIAESKTSTGVRGYDTLRGVFSVIEKHRHHYSNLYNGAPMPYMQRLTWSGTAMHTGYVTGRPASHGCIRLPNSFAARLWRMTKLGTRVIVARHNVEPAAISHPTLASLRHTPLSEAIAQMEKAAGKMAANEGPVTDGFSMPMPNMRQSQKSDAVNASDTKMAPVELRVSPVTPPVMAMGSDAPEKDVDAPAAAPVIAKDIDASEKGVEVPVAAPVMAKGVETPEQGVDAPAAAAPSVAPAVTELVPTPAPAPALLKELKPGPLAMFISRKEGKLFVRKGFKPMFEMPVTIANPEQPLGTHVFTATAYNDDRETFRWMSVSLPPEQRRVSRSKRSRRHHRAARNQADAPVIASGTASEALSRVEIPQDVRDRIGYLLEPGSSLTISDKGLGRYTGKGTGFIVLSR